MKHSLIFLVLAVLQLSLGWPFEGSVKTEAAENSELDNSSLFDAAPSSRAQISGKFAESSQVVGGAKAASGEQVAGEAQIAAGGAQPKLSGQVDDRAQASGKAHAEAGAAQSQLSGRIAIEALAPAKAQAAGEVQTAEGPQAAGVTQANRGAQIQLSGQVAGAAHAASGEAQAAGGAQAQLPGHAAGETQVAGRAQPNGNSQSQLSLKTAGPSQPQISRPTAVGAQAAGGAKASEGVQVFVKSQTYLSGQVNGGAQAAAGGAQAAAGGAQAAAGGVQAAAGGAQAAAGGAQAAPVDAQAAKGSDANRAPQDGAEAAHSSQGSGGAAAPKASLFLSSGLQRSQSGMQVTRSESSPIQTSKEGQAQIVYGTMSSNLPINIPVSVSGGSERSVGQTSDNARAQAGVEITT